MKAETALSKMWKRIQGYSILFLVFMILATGCAAGRNAGDGPEEENASEAEISSGTEIYPEKEKGTITAFICVEGRYDSEEYADKEEFLTAYGLDAQQPYYEYYNEDGQLQLELYYEEETGKGGGIRYVYSEHEVAARNGFVFDESRKENWADDIEANDKFSLQSVEGSTGEEAVLNYEETYEYNENGQITLYHSLGDIDWLTDELEQDETVLRIKFEYREDGTLAYKEYWHNPFVFSTYSTNRYSYYDTAERLMYEDAYLTHGSLDIYYLYAGDETVPTYKLELDNNLGTWFPRWITYDRTEFPSSENSENLELSEMERMIKWPGLAASDEWHRYNIHFCAGASF